MHAMRISYARYAERSDHARWGALLESVLRPWTKSMLPFPYFRGRDPVPFPIFGILNKLVIERSSFPPPPFLPIRVSNMESGEGLNHRERKLAPSAVAEPYWAGDQAYRHPRSLSRMQPAFSPQPLRSVAHSWVGLVCRCYGIRLQREGEVVR
jgi:hypothetical protein